MKKIKSTLLIVLAVSVLMPVLEGCKKYEEGPMISFKSKTKRLAQVWTISDRMVDGASELDSYHSSLTVEFTADGFYQEKSGSTIEFEGQWIFNDSKKKIGIKYTGETEYEYFEIVKLKGKELWLKGEDGTSVVETQYVPGS